MFTVGMPMYRIRTFFTGSPVSDGLSTCHYDASAGTPGQAQSAHGFMLGTFTPFIQNAQVYTVSGDIDLIDEATGDLIDSTSGPDFDVSTTGTEQGLPPITQLMIRLATGVVVAGHRLKGRLFLPGFTELANVNPGVPDAGLVSGAQANLDDWTTGSDAQPVVWHRPKGAAPGSFSPVTGASVWGEWAVLRQRRPLT